ncbi:MAG: hypothetical protein JWP95_1934 [Actinotalea sp.]|nr:hypothetical protein [Actinotalea sp.]
MNENTPVPPGQDDSARDALVERLRAADPAAGAAPDRTALRAAVDERVAAGRTDELAAARARRWTSWPARVAGVAAAALVIGGGGGYAVGAASEQDPPAAAEEMTAADAGAGDSPAEEGSAGTAPEMGPEMGVSSSPIGPGAPQSSMVAADEAGRSYWPGMGRTVFTASGLSEDGGSGRAWAFDPAAAFTEESITAVAAALGVPGTATFMDGYWSVGPMDGTGANVSLQPDGTASVSYYDPTRDPWSCAVALEDAATTGDGTREDLAEDPATSMIAPEPCEQRDLGAAPVGDAALTAAREILASLGQDPAAFELRAETWDTSWSSVTAERLVDGQKTGAVWSLSFTGAGLQNLYGPLAPLVSLGEYDVVSPAEAVRRLTDPRFGGGWGGPIAYAEGAEPVPPQTDAATSGPASVPVPASGSLLSWPVDEVTIVEARLVGAMSYQPDGSSLILPTYELVSDDGAIWTVLAVADQHLDFSPVG